MKSPKNKLISYLKATKTHLDSIVDRILTVFTEFSTKSYVHSDDDESSSADEVVSSDVTAEIGVDRLSSPEHTDKDGSDLGGSTEKVNLTEIILDVEENGVLEIEEKAVITTAPTSSTGLSVPPEEKIGQKSALQYILGCFGCFKRQET